MRRRAYLRGIGVSTVGLAGCLGTFGGTGGDQNGITITTDDALTKPAISISVSVEEEATAEQPTVLDITIHNRKGSSGSNVAQTIEVGPEPPFSSLVGTGPDGAKLVLEPILLEGMETSATHGGGRCWYAHESLVTYLTGLETDERQTMTLDAGGGVYLTYYLLGHHANDPCMPAGTYRFESNEYGLPSGPSNVEWGFDLTVGSSIETSVNTTT